MRQRKWAGILSIFVFVASIASLFVYGLNLGLDFSGGTQIEASFVHPINTAVIRKNLLDQGFPRAVVRVYDAHHILVRVASHKTLTQEQIKKKLMQVILEGTIDSVDYIGPQVNQKSLEYGGLAIIASLISTAIYIIVRFDLRFAVGAFVALIHDPILILGIFSFFHLEFNLVVLAAILTVIGYSLNDTIVVFDRIRENLQKDFCRTPMEVVDLSVNQVFSRTMIISGLTLIVVIVLFVCSENTVLRPFSLALIIGIITGTYSSIYIASSLAVITFGFNQRPICPITRIEE
ncbi:protein translocase subunit SecF [Coxiella endosymbiont of Amblyomma sculptum]|uniref:protein translocase subunit SecF n=1 Tax=Coxiella endosymbiont of Amblyomma sculptum TaxID=2487929 RepID=UPI001FEAFAAE|nr:protein translocase subunit SecF [Coxiella endosymbiont of Amblyomma sculptum]